MAGFNVSDKTKPDPAYHDKEFVRSLAGDRTEMAAASTYKPSKLTAANEWFRRKVDKIPTPVLRGAVSPHADGSGYHSEDSVTGERFYLMVDEVKRELARRDALALKLAEEMYAAYGTSAGEKTHDGKWMPKWDALKETQGHWQAAAEYVIEKYRCLL